MQYYHISPVQLLLGRVIVGTGKRPLEERHPIIEGILEERRPTHELDRGSPVYLRQHKDFSTVGVTYYKGYIHIVEPIGNIRRRDLVWTGILQERHARDMRFRRDRCPLLTDGEIADLWWAGEASDQPDWEFLAERASVIEAESSPVIVKPFSPLLNIFDV